MTTAPETSDVVATAPGPVPGNVAVNGEAQAAAAGLLEAHAAEQAAPKVPKGKVFASWIELQEKEARVDDVLIRMRLKGENVERYVRIEAISSTDYDALIAKHKPTQKQIAEGATYNPDTFIPALISVCLTNPKLSVEQVKALYESDTWSGGEIGGLFIRCQRVCQGNPDVAFTEAD